MSVVLSREREDRAREVIARCKTDRVAFAKSFFGVDMLGRQAELLNLGGTVRVAICGRRFGKSLTTLIGAVHSCVTNPRQQWYVTAPSIDQAKIYFAELERAIGQNPLLERVVKPKSFGYNPFPHVEFKSGSKLEARSTTLDGKYLRGKGADGICVTEAAFVKDVVWNEVIRAMLLDRRGVALIESTPNGSGNWTYNLDQIGQKDGTGYYKAFHATCYDNPRLDKDEIERIRLEIPDIAFRQEYLAEYVDDDSAVFPWAVLSEIIEDYRPLGRPLDEHQYAIGVDLAKSQDFTVICVLDVTATPYRIAEWHRFQGVLYTDVAARVNAIAARYNARVWLDATGVGEAVAEQVENCERIVFTPRLRDDLLSRLVVVVEGHQIELPASLTELRDEMRYFRRVKHGDHVKAEAPAGHHDDQVMGLALAVYGASGGGWGGLFAYYRQQREMRAAATAPKRDARGEAI